MQITWETSLTRLTSTKKFTNLNLSQRQKNQAILYSNYLNLTNLDTSPFLDSEGLQGIRMEALNPFNSKLMTLTAR